MILLRFGLNLYASSEGRFTLGVYFYSPLHGMPQSGSESGCNRQAV